jgi:hypothetical protein
MRGCDTRRKIVIRGAEKRAENCQKKHGSVFEEFGFNRLLSTPRITFGPKTTQIKPNRCSGLDSL